MVRLLVTFNCVDCGELTTRMRQPKQPRICFECGIARAVDAAVELARCKAEGWGPNSKYPRERFTHGGRPPKRREQTNTEV